VTAGVSLDINPSTALTKRRYRDFAGKAMEVFGGITT
jgi:hypothetical protein